MADMNSTRAPQSRAHGPDERGWPRAVLILLVVVGVGLFGRRLAGGLPHVLESVRELGPWAGIAFVAVYAVATVAWVPGSVLTLASGALFGLVRGTALTLVGATLGASLAFLLSRRFARGIVARRMDGDTRLRAVHRALEREGPRVVLLLRLSPAFPFNALNYALGAMPIRFRDYVGMSLVGMAPGTFLYVYGGYTAGRLVTDVSGAGLRGPASYALLGVGLLATVAVTFLVTRAARKALAETGAVEDEPLTAETP